MERHHRQQTQEGRTKFTWPQVYLWSFLRPNPQCSCIHKTQRQEKQRSPLLPRLDICKKEQQTIQESEKSGISHSQKYRKHTMVKTYKKKKNNNNQNKQFCPRPFGRISRLSLTIKLRFDDMLKHSIWDLGSPQAKSHLNVFGFKCQTVEQPNLRLGQIWSLKLTSPTCLDSNAKPLDHSIWDLGSPQAKSHPNVFGFECQAVGPLDLRLG